MKTRIQFHNSESGDTRIVIGMNVWNCYSKFREWCGEKKIRWLDYNSVSEIETVSDNTPTGIFEEEQNLMCGMVADSILINQRQAGRDFDEYHIEGFFIGS